MKNPGFPNVWDKIKTTPAALPISMRQYTNETMKQYNNVSINYELFFGEVETFR
jgi:hypothetical protein